MAACGDTREEMIKIMGGFTVATAVASFLGCGIGSVISPCRVPSRPSGVSETSIAGTYTGPDHATVELHPDRSVKIDVVLNTFNGLGHLSGEGTWSLREERPERTANPEYVPGDITIKIETDSAIRVDEDLHVGGSAERPALWFYFGDVDSCDIRVLERKL